MKYVLKYGIPILLLICVLIFLDKKYGRLDVENLQVAAATTKHSDVSTLVSLVDNVREQVESSSQEPIDTSQLFGHIFTAINPTFDCEYYDAVIPYWLSAEEVGGIQLTTETDHYTGAVWKGLNSPSNEEGYEMGNPALKVGQFVNTIGDSSTVRVGQGTTRAVSHEGALSYVTSPGGKKFYCTAIQMYFFPNDPAKEWFGFGYPAGDDPKEPDKANNPFYESGRSGSGNLLGVCLEVLTAKVDENGNMSDFKATPFVVTDFNAVAHTNHGKQDFGDSYTNDYTQARWWYTTELLHPEFVCIMSCHSFNCLEIFGSSGCTNEMASKLGLENNSGDGSSSVKIIGYRIYKNRFLDM